MHDASEPRYRAIVTVSSAPQTLEAATRLAELSEAPDDTDNPIPACVAVLLASALAQGIHTRLRTEAHQQAFQTSTAIEDTDPWRLSLQNVAFRKKLLELPRVCSLGRFALRPDSLHVQALENLVTLRNRLVHIEEEPSELAGVEVQVDASGARSLEIQVPVPKNPWLAVRLPEAHKFRTAVTTYFDQVLDVSAENYVEGELLRRSP